MSFRLDKSLKILNELVTFFYKRGCNNFDVKLDFESTASIYTFEFKMQRLSKETFDYIYDNLNVERQAELEEAYWALSGDSSLDGEDQIPLVGVMVDEASMTYEDNKLKIVVKRIESNH